MAHSKLGPSGAKRWLNCAGSVALEAKMPKRSSPAAAQGSVAHKIAEEFHTGKVDLIELQMRVGEIVKYDGFDIEIDEQMIDEAVNYHEVIEQLTTELFAQRKSSPVVSKTEAEVKAPSIHADVWGTADKIVYRKGDVLLLVDYKYGKGVVEVEENDQLMQYAVAVMDTESGWAFDKVVLVVVQPRASHEEGRVRRWDTTPAFLREYAKKAQRAAVETQNPNAKRTPDSEWCRWCRAQTICPEFNGVLTEKAKQAFNAAPLQPGVVHSLETMLPKMREMEAAKLVDAMRWEETFNSFFETAKAVLAERKNAGEQIDGVKFVAKRSNRQWVNETEVENKYFPVVGDKLFKPREMISPAQLEKVMGAKAKPEINALTFKPEAGRSLVLDSDPRPAIASSAQQAFAALPDETAVVDELEALMAGTATAKEPFWPS